MSFGRFWERNLILFLSAIFTAVLAKYHRYDALLKFHGNQGDSRVKFTNSTRKFADHYRINESGGPLRIPHIRHHRVIHNRGPYFENADGQEINDTQIVAHLGDTALLDCRVVMLSGKQVMWIRQSPETALLTIDVHTHTSDLRYAVDFRYPNNYRLAISSIRKEDEGEYVCQISTHPPRTLTTNVTILAPDIRIIDEANHEIRDRYYKTGSLIELTCIARPSRPSSRVPHPVWEKNNEILPDHVSISHSNGTNNELKTRLRIEHAKKTDGGEFTCTIDQFSKSKVNIHVLNGEKQAAVHHDQWTSTSCPISKNEENIRFAISSLFILKLIIFFLLSCC